MVDFEKCSLRPPGKSFDPVEAYGLKPLVSDSDVIDMVKQVGSMKVIEVYIELWLSAIDYESVSKPAKMSTIDTMYQNPCQTHCLWKKRKKKVFEKGKSSMPNIGEDEDVMVDEDNIIKDVQVDMGDFRRKYNKNVEWEGFTEHQVEHNDDFEDEELNLEDFDSEIDCEDDVEEERNKALRKKFGNKSLVLKIVSKVVVEQRRQLHVFKNDKFRVRVKCNDQTHVFKTFHDVNPVEEDGSGYVDKLSKEVSGPVDKHIKDVSGPVNGPIVKNAKTYP
ncbi:hypothetical protein Tco_0966902 [Tanacetum coccineum]